MDIKGVSVKTFLTSQQDASLSKRFGQNAFWKRFLETNFKIITSGGINWKILDCERI
jgi:hypothetical protein